MPDQQQFLNVIDRDEAARRFEAALDLTPSGVEEVELDAALGRVLGEDVISTVDVPSFDRSNFDGFAVRAVDTVGASETQPRELQLLPGEIATGVVSGSEVQLGTGISIATGGMLPRGADAVVMIEHCDVNNNRLIIRKSVAPGFGVAFAGTDIALGETVLHAGVPLTSRETGVLAAVGIDRVAVFRRPIVAILSTGDEIIAPGAVMRPPLVYDSNARVIADAVRELGGEALPLGIVPDDYEQLRTAIGDALTRADCVLLSGGTSKGNGDISYRVVGEFHDPGVVAHGVALKPGKPICLAVTNNKPVVILPGFPTSAIFTFHEFVAPVLRRLAGRSSEQRATLPAQLAVRVNSEIGRTEYLLVGLVESSGDLPHVAYPMGKGSGSVTTFARADGFITIDRHEEIVEAGAAVDVTLLGRDLRPADLVVIGSHCLGLDVLLSEINRQGWRSRMLTVGSTAGLQAAKRGECDIASMHLLDETTGEYNLSFLNDDVTLVSGYGRMQGVVYRRGDARFDNKSAKEAIASIIDTEKCRMVNRNQGSGTRILIDRLLAGEQPPGYAVQAKSHYAVAAAVVQGRADWGVAIETVANRSQLGFLPLTEEQYDFVVPKSRLERPAVKTFIALLRDQQVRAKLIALGFSLNTEHRTLKTEN